MNGVGGVLFYEIHKGKFLKVASRYFSKLQNPRFALNFIYIFYFTFAKKSNSKIKIFLLITPSCLGDTSKPKFGLAALRPMAKAKLKILRVLML